jgi:hypothetical protein
MIMATHVGTKRDRGRCGRLNCLDARDRRLAWTAGGVNAHVHVQRAGVTLALSPCMGGYWAYCCWCLAGKDLISAPAPAGPCGDIGQHVLQHLTQLAAILVGSYVLQSHLWQAESSHASTLDNHHSRYTSTTIDCGNVVQFQSCATCEAARAQH